MPFPPPSPGRQTATLYPEERRSPTENQLRVYRLGLSALRRVRVAMKVSPMTNQVAYPGQWWCNARSTLRFPERDLFPVGSGPNGNKDIHFAPSLVPVPALGAGLMSVFELYLPPQPEVESVTFYFSSELDPPAAQTYVFGYPDSGRHDFDGLFLTPSGPGSFLRREPGDGGDPEKFVPNFDGSNDQKSEIDKDRQRLMDIFDRLTKRR